MAKYDQFGSTGKDAYFTPPWLCDLLRDHLGGIDLDPFSEPLANAFHVKAKSFYTKEDDGLSLPWFGNVLVNPPGGKKRLGQKAWKKLMDEFRVGRVKDFAFVAFSTDYLQTTQGLGCDSMQDFWVTVPSKRLPYWEVDPEDPSRTREAAYWDAKRSKWQVAAMRPSLIVTLCQIHPDLWEQYAPEGLGRISF